MHDLVDIQQRFDRDGFVVVKDLVTPQRLAAVREQVDAVLDGAVKPTRSGMDDFVLQWEPRVKERADLPRREKIRVAFHLAHSHRYFWDLATDPGVLDVIEALVGPDVRYYTDQMFVKPARHGSEVPWHQDSAYWPMAQPGLVSCWLAIDDVTVANGCVRFVPGSHKAALGHHYVESENPNKIAARPEYCEPDREVPVELKAGDACIHHSLCLHRSLPNETDKPRRGLVMIYLPADLKVYEPWDFEYGFAVVRGEGVGESLGMAEAGEEPVF